MSTTGQKWVAFLTIGCGFGLFASVINLSPGMTFVLALILGLMLQARWEEFDD